MSPWERGWGGLSGRGTYDGLGYGGGALWCGHGSEHGRGHGYGRANGHGNYRGNGYGAGHTRYLILEGYALGYGGGDTETNGP